MENEASSTNSCTKGWKQHFVDAVAPRHTEVNAPAFGRMVSKHLNRGS